MAVALGSTGARGYWLITSDGMVLAHGALEVHGSPRERGSLATPCVAIAATASGRGYWVIEGGGRVHGFGDASPLTADVGPVTAVATTSGGAWIVAATGVITALGEAPPPPTSAPTEAPIVAPNDAPVVAAATAGGGAAWLLTRDGRVHALDGRGFGDPYALGVGTLEFVGLGATPTGNGYWVVCRHGEVFGFGDADAVGSPITDGEALPDVVAIDTTLPGGYVLVTARGMVLPFGALDLGPTPPPVPFGRHRARVVGAALVAHAGFDDP